MGPFALILLRAYRTNGTLRDERVNLHGAPAVTMHESVPRNPSNQLEGAF
jgi:hypothetical protein